MMKDSTIVAAITLMGVVITAFVTWVIAQRQIIAKNVTEERAKWRGKIRAQALEAQDAIVFGNESRARRLKSEFRALLNPLDCHDQAILGCMTVNGSRRERERRMEEFAKRISLLLKHDWERAKLEAGFFLWRWILEPKRVPFESLNRGGNVFCACKGLRFRDKFKLRRASFPSIVAAVVVVGIVVCLWKNIPRVPTEDHGTQVPMGVDTSAVRQSR